MENHENKSKVATKADLEQLELTTIPHDDEAPNNRRLVLTKDVDAQTEPIIVILDQDMAKGQRYVLINGNDVRQTLNEEKTLDLTQGTVVTENLDNTPNKSMINNCRVVEVVHDQSTVTTSNIINDIEVNFGPILGYAEEPLLPLVKACAPLTTLIPNLLFYVELALIETPEQPADGLTIDESAAIRLYTIEWTGKQRSLYSMLNHTLKKDTRDNLRPYFKYLKLFLTALAKLPCVPQCTVWRGVTKDLSAQFPLGSPVIWWGFSSCTTSLPVLENNMYLGTRGERTLFSAEVINGRTIRAHSHFVTEDEILLLPGTQMIVQSQFSPADDLHIVHLKQVVPEEVLLEPPFEGILKFFNHVFSTKKTSISRCTSLSKSRVSLLF